MPVVSSVGSSGGGTTPEEVADSGLVIPVGDSTGPPVVDSTTYDNTVTGSGKLTALVFPADTVAFALALAGDDFPRALFLSDATDAVFYLGDGTFDPYSSGPALNFSDGGMSVSGPFRLQGTVNASALPTADPHVAGDLYTLAGVVNVSAG